MIIDHCKNIISTTDLPLWDWNTKTFIMQTKFKFIISIPAKQSILEAMEHLFAKYLDIRPLFFTPARPIKDEWKISPYFGVFPFFFSALWNKKVTWIISQLNPLPLPLIFIFSVLFSIHFLKYWQGEFAGQSRLSLVSNNFPYSCDLNPLTPKIWLLILPSSCYTFPH